MLLNLPSKAALASPEASGFDCLYEVLTSYIIRVYNDHESLAIRLLSKRAKYFKNTYGDVVLRLCLGLDDECLTLVVVVSEEFGVELEKIFPGSGHILSVI